MAPSVLLVEDHQLLAQSLAAHLQASGLDVDLVDVERTSAVELLRQGLSAGVVVLDLDLGPAPGGTHRDGASLVAPLTQGGTRVVVVTGNTSLALWGRCLVLGAEAVLAKTEPVDRVTEVVTAVAEGRRVAPPPWREAALRAWQQSREQHARLVGPLQRLTPREAEVLGLLAEGLTTALIATRDVVSEATVRSQIKSILQKLGVSSQLQAVAVYHRARATGWTARTAGPAGPR